MEIGVSMFADLALDPRSGKPTSAGKRLKELIEEIRLADQVGLDVFGIGEHHRPDYAVSSPETILAAAATVTENIILGSAVTVLSSSDPVKIYQRFSTIDLISDGRVELMAGRGSFIESFPLFGYNLQDYHVLFEEKLDLLLKINQNEWVTWEGSKRPPLKNQQVLPRAGEDGLSIWLASGGTPESIQRAGILGLPLILAIIGGSPAQFLPHVDLYRQTYQSHEHSPEHFRLGIHSHGLIGEDSKKIQDLYFPLYAAQMDRIGKDRGWPSYTRSQYDHGLSPQGAIFVGEPEEVAEKITNVIRLFGLTRFMLHMDVGAPSHLQLMKSIELLGTRVAPLVRENLNT